MEVEAEARREANSCLTSSQSEAGLRLTKTVGPGRAPPPHPGFEAFVEMCLQAALPPFRGAVQMVTGVFGVLFCFF